MIYLSNEPYPQEISVPRSFGVIVPQRNTYLSTADIATDLTTDSDQKVLAASQGVALKEMVDAKADASDVYTKQEVDADLALKADADDVYTKQEVDEALAGKQDELVAGDNITIEGNVISATGGGSGDSYTRAETDALLAEKADVDDVYTKSEVDTALAGKANANAVYTKGEVDEELADKQDVITDLATIRSGAAAGATAVQPAELSAGLATKQDTLESGVNIKTINNQSLLGSGNIDIQGGGGEPEIFWAEYGVTTYADVQAAYNSGKLCAVSYNNRAHILATGVGSNYILFGAVNSSAIYVVQVSSSDVWGSNSFAYEKITNKKTDIAANKDSNTYYPTTKAVYDALGKYGVISQTQTWTGSASTGYTYTMSNQVWGLIPQAFIDEVTAFVYATAGITFNETTGYFELNGLTDISYDEMRVIWATRQRNGYDYAQPMILPQSCRTNFTLCSAGNGNGGDGISISSPTLFQCNIEYFRFSTIGGYGSMIPGRYKFTPYGNLFYQCKYLRIISDNLEITRAQAGLFMECYSLEWVAFYKLAYNVDLHWSPNLRTDCLAYTINNAGTATFTITLHATAYARAIADADVQAALAAHTNVSLASA